MGGSNLPNLLCVLPGETDRRIYVGAHYVAVKEAEGIIDNWTGASLLPTLYWSLKAKPRKHTFVFAGFADEERGLIGSRSHVKRLPKDQLGRISALVNIDTLGLSPSKVWASQASPLLVDRARLRFHTVPPAQDPHHHLPFADSGDAAGFAYQRRHDGEIERRCLL